MRLHGHGKDRELMCLSREGPSLTCSPWLSARLELNMASLQRATNLLRTRVEITQEQQNAQVLKSMAQRADMQVRGQATGGEGTAMILKRLSCRPAKPARSGQAPTDR